MQLLNFRTFHIDMSRCRSLRSKQTPWIMRPLASSASARLRAHAGAASASRPRAPPEAELGSGISTNTCPVAPPSLALFADQASHPLLLPSR